MAALEVAVTGVVLDDDWLAPAGSPHALLARLRRSHSNIQLLADTQLGVRADHFAWMKQPQAVVQCLLASLR